MGLTTTFIFGIITIFVFCVICCLIGLIMKDKNTTCSQGFQWLILASLVGAIINILIIDSIYIRSITKVPVVVETISQPQIDTTVVISNGATDTTYTYTFPNIVIE